MSTTASIRTFLETRLAAITNIPELALEGKSYERKTGVPYVRLKLMPAETVTNSIGANYVLELRGLAQIDVFYSLLLGKDAAEATAQSIVTAFLPAVFTEVNGDQIVIENSWVEQIREEPTLLHVPVLVRWRAFRL